MNEHLVTNTPVVLNARRQAMLAGFDNKLEVLVRIQAPATAAHADGSAKPPRPPYAIALVLDRSGSMSGPPLAEAKRCAAFVADRLRGDDQVALVAFDHRVHTLQGALPRGDGYALKAAIAGIHPAGNTDLHGGWRAGADALADLPVPAGQAAGAGLKRVILLSDGCANAGTTDAAEIAKQCAELAARNISTSTYGLGNGFNEELMIAMGQSGQGSHYYGDTADDLMEPFEQELALMDNLCIKGLTLRASVPAGVKVDLLNPFQGSLEAGWRLPDLAYGAEAWCVLCLTVPKSLVPAEGKTLHFLEITASGEDLEANQVLLAPARLTLPAVSAAALSAVAEDEMVVRRMSELEASTLLAVARGAAGAGNWNEVDRMLAEAEVRFAGNPWVASVLESIRKLAKRRSRAEFMKEASYSSSSMSLRLAARNESLTLSEQDKAAYLRRKKAQGKSEFARRPEDGGGDAGAGKPA